MSETVPFTTEELSRKACAEEPGHDHRARKGSGIWGCELTTLTPLCIQSYFSKLKDGDPAVLPASSLRGMVRNVAELLGAGCARFHSDEQWAGPQLETCSERSACLVCRVFGFVEGDYAWAGKVRIGDSRPQKVQWERFSLPNTQREPQHNAEKGGWILFPHTPMPRLGAGPTRCVKAGHKFGFRVEYLNLDEEEYAVLKFALTLEHGDVKLCHKLGYAKALGLGACTISIPGDKSEPAGGALERYLRLPGYPALKQFRSYR